MGLVNAKEVAKAINVDKFGFLGTFMGWSLMKILNITTLNKIYDRNKHLQDLEFVNALLALDTVVVVEEPLSCAFIFFIECIMRFKVDLFSWVIFQ